MTGKVGGGDDDDAEEAEEDDGGGVAPGANVRHSDNSPCGAALRSRPSDFPFLRGNQVA